MFSRAGIDGDDGAARSVLYAETPVVAAQNDQVPRREGAALHVQTVAVDATVLDQRLACETIEMRDLGPPWCEHDGVLAARVGRAVVGDDALRGLLGGSAQAEVAAVDRDGQRFS